MTGATLHSIRVGRVRPFGPAGVPSGYLKHRIDDPIAVGVSGLAGDEQAEHDHGGRDKAVYGYPLDHYPAWQADNPQHRDALVAGSMGENLTIAGLTEATACVGDVHRIGSATLQLCQPRQPCSKLALYFGDPLMVKAMVRNGRAGWYYRVLEAGTMRAGDAVACIDRPHPDFAFTRLVEIVNFGGATADELIAMSEMDGLAACWRDDARHRLGNAKP